MQIGEMQHREAVEDGRQALEADDVLDQPRSRRILLAAPIEAGQLQAGSDQRPHRIPVIDVEEIESAAENACFLVTLDAEPLARVNPPEPLLQPRVEIIALIHAASRLRCRRWSMRSVPGIRQPAGWHLLGG